MRPALGDSRLFSPVNVPGGATSILAAIPRTVDASLTPVLATGWRLRRARAFTGNTPRTAWRGDCGGGHPGGPGRSVLIQRRVGAAAAGLARCRWGGRRCRLAAGSRRVEG